MKSRRKARKGSRERILEAAVDEFAEFGLAGARVDRIARRAGVNKAMIYYHFDSKDDLYKKVFRAQIEDKLEYLRAKIEGARDVKEILLVIAENYHRGLEPGSKLVPILLREMASGGRNLRDLVREMGSGADLRGGFLGIIDKGRREGRYREVDSRQALISFFGMNLFYLLMAPLINQVWEISDEDEFRARRPRQVVDLFMRGLEAR